MDALDPTRNDSILLGLKTLGNVGIFIQTRVGSILCKVSPRGFHREPQFIVNTRGSATAYKERGIFGAKNLLSQSS